MSAAKKKAPEAEESRPAGPAPTPRLRTRYEQEILPALAKKLGRKNRLSLPKLQKIVVNMGVGAAISEKKYLEEAVGAMTQITGQKPLVTSSRVAVSGFKLRENMAIGCKVTLRGNRMFEFLDRLISLALPRVRDFRGLNPNAFDGHGNYSLGLSEQLVFPELNPDKYTRVQGMNVTLVTSTNNNDEARELLRGFGLPFKQDETKQGKSGAA
ncbi:MAG TPA: 50S ribosomal protein L5 [Pirellulales bacterium]|nr:50S ribosomal protein L5 [Pirellulales bacterium]